jgi:2-amino-4-hydroxy-6-hydroxymethyldihydropteridine diphosphokinase
MNPIECGIALGSNTGDRLAYLHAALEKMRALDPQLEVSPVYETEPVNCPGGSGAFLNAVTILHWNGTPVSLLEWLRGIESELGRPLAREKNSPRTIDLDILYAGDAVLRTEELTLPHPRLHQRRFVLQPLSDLRPALLLPGMSGTVAEMLAALPPETIKRL